MGLHNVVGAQPSFLIRRFRKPPFEEQWKPKADTGARSSEMLQGALRMLAGGYDEKTEAALSIPQELFYSQGSCARFYSQADRHSLPGFLAGFSMGKLIHPKTPYGIVLFETTNHVNFVLIDLRRKIVVRERLLSNDGQHGQVDWTMVKSHVEAALELASTEEARKGGLFAVHVCDGQFQLMKMTQA